MRELRTVIDVGLEISVLLLRGRVSCRLAEVCADIGVVVVCPLDEVVCELVAGQVSGGVFEVDDDQLLVLVGGLEEGGLLVIWLEAENVAILSLKGG
jgi:hypothetical protein